MRALALLAAVAACGHKVEPPAPAPLAVPADSGPRYDPSHLPRGLDVRLSDGAQGPAARDHGPVQGRPIADVAALFAGMKPLAAAAPVAFSLRPGSLPPPRPGDAVAASFAGQGSAAPPHVETGALRVLRYQPEGGVSVAGRLSITFNQPMVAITSQSAAAATQPVKLSPEPKGTWRWIGTRTLVFDADPRFPQATAYQVEIPAGTKSATGGVLGKPVRFSFATPPVTLESYWPIDDGDPKRPDTAMVAWFDQRVDAAAALAKLAVRANGREVAVRALTAAELAALPDEVRGRIGAKVDGRWIAFRAADPLPLGAQVAVAVRAGMPSAEGPRTTEAAQGFSFHTFGAFRFDMQSCAVGCSPGSWLGIAFTNPIDAVRFDEHLVTVEPAVDGLHVIAEGRTLELAGDLHARTHYRVHVARALADAIGQTLPKDLDATFAMGDPEPALLGPQGLVTLDPAKPRALAVYSTSVAALDVKIYRVAPADYDAFEKFIGNRWNHLHPSPPPGALARSERVAVHAGSDVLTDTAIDLAPALTGGEGDAVAVVTPVHWPRAYGDPPEVIAWAQATHLGLDAHADGEKLIAYASDLATGKPLGDVGLAYGPGEPARATDATGVATLPLPSTNARLLIATAGTDHAFVVSYAGRWGVRSAPDLTWYVADDRALYRPGETVALKGWLRVRGRDVEPIDPSIAKVAYRVFDAQSNEIAKGEAKLGRLGGFSTTFALPATPATGYARVELTAGASTFEHELRVEEIRRPEFEVAAHASEAPVIVAGSGADVTAVASYYAGGPLAGADVAWTAMVSPTVFTPPNRDDYAFGAWPRYDGDDPDAHAHVLPARWTHAGTTDATGTSVLHLAFPTVDPATPMSVIAEASVRDVNHQTWATSTALLVHPSAAYVGLKAKLAFAAQGTPFEIGVIGVGLDGKPLPGAKIALRAVRLDWEYKAGRYRTKEVDPQTCDVIAADAEQRCTFATPKGGSYRVVATITDSRGRPNRSELDYYVTGGAIDPNRTDVALIPDDKTYTVGQTAHVLVASPFYPAEGLVTWRRNGIVKAERITLAGPSTVIDVPITEALVPNVSVNVDVVGRAPGVDAHGAPDPKLPMRMAYATGAATLSIPPRTRALNVTIAPNAPVAAPGAAARLAVRVVDAAGRPVAGADVAVIAVDEAVLSLAAYTHPNPLDTFYAELPPGVEDASSRALTGGGFGGGLRGGEGYGDGWGRGVNLPMGRMARAEAQEDFDGTVDKSEPTDELAPSAPMAQPMAFDRRAFAKDDAKNASGHEGKMGKRESAAGPVAALRSNFNPLAVFTPDATTGADGTASVTLTLPDNLTRYRLVAIAAAGATQFGKGESALTARLPLMVRPSAPRFLSFGDSFRLPVSVQNQTDAPLTVRVGVRASDLAITAGAGREITVPPNDRVLVEIPMAAQHPGTARLQVVAKSDAYSDAAELAIPVRTPATTEAFATYGVIDGSALPFGGAGGSAQVRAADGGAVALPVALPGKIVPDFGGVEVSAASTNLASLTDALLYLVHYPYECGEQRASRIAAIAALRDEIAAFHAQDLPGTAALDQSMADDLEHLANFQTADGGFAYWDHEPSDPYLTIFVVDALARARAKGLAVPPALVERARPYIANIEAHLDDEWDPATKTALSAYALATRARLGDRDLAKGEIVLANAGDHLTVEAAGWLLQLFGGAPNAAAERAQLVRFAMNHVSETAGAANFTTGYRDDNAHLLLASDRRADAVMLDGLVAAAPDNDLIPKIVQGLLAHRTKGHWDNTQEDAFVLLALDRYFRTYEKIDPDFIARVWLGDGYAGDHRFAGRTAETYSIAIPMTEVARRSGSALAIAKAGAGRLYYRIAMTYAPAETKLAPAENGFAVARRYEGVDDPHDVSRDADGTWRIKVGARVRVRVAMVNDDRRYQVALVDPLPAGLEPLNASLNGTGAIPRDPASAPWWDHWYEHEDVRDDRVEAFTRLLGEGVHEYTYVARATTAGDFAVAPPKAEEMYSPETFGRGASDRVVVE